MRLSKHITNSNKILEVNTYKWGEMRQQMTTKKTENEMFTPQQQRKSMTSCPKQMPIIATES